MPRITRTLVLMAVALGIDVPAALQGQGNAPPAAAVPPAGLASDTARPYFRLVRAALEEHHPHLLSRGVAGRTAFLWFHSDGAGQITRTAVDSVPPRSQLLSEIIRERWPDVDPDSLTRSVAEPMYPNAFASWHRPGEFGPDSLEVFWIEQPVGWGQQPKTVGPYAAGMAVARQITPREVRAAALGAAQGESVWYLYDDERPLIEAGTYRGEPALEGVREMLTPRHPGTVLTCSMASVVPNAGGDPVRVISVRIEPRPQTP